MTELAKLDRFDHKGYLEHPDSVSRLEALGIDPQQAKAAALLALTRQPQLAKCSAVSVFKALMDGAELGLSCSGAAGQGYLVPYKGSCQFLPGYRGLLHLATKSGRVKAIDSQLHCENDELSIELGTNTVIIHKPAFGKRGEIVGAYAVATLAGGVRIAEYMTREEIDAIRRSSAAQGGPWSSHYGEMARKTMIRRIIKRLPTEADSALNRALELENAVDQGREEAATGSNLTVADFEKDLPDDDDTLEVLSPHQLDHLQDYAKEAGVEWDAVEQKHGGPIEGLAVAGLTSKELTVRILDGIDALAEEV